MLSSDVPQTFVNLDKKWPSEAYNYQHFRTQHLLSDVQGTIEQRGIQPGTMAPDFDLPRVGGGRLRLSELQGKPTLLHFGSFTWPVTIGSVEPLKKLYARWGQQVNFVDVVIRQAHPGPGVPPYRRFEQKMQDAYRYQQEEGIPWTILVDDLAGTTHQVYGSLADPTYLIDAEGRVAFYNTWTYAPALHEALAELFAQGGRGVVKGGVDRTLYLLPAMTDGWRGLRCGLWQSFIDLETAAPGMASSIWLGYQLRPLTAPLTLRAEPLPASLKLGLAVGAVALLILGARRLSPRPQPVEYLRG